MNNIFTDIVILCPIIISIEILICYLRENYYCNNNIKKINRIEELF